MRETIFVSQPTLLEQVKVQEELLMLQEVSKILCIYANKFWLFFQNFCLILFIILQLKIMWIFLLILKITIFLKVVVDDLKCIVFRQPDCDSG
jgi:hypothetical protein